METTEKKETRQENFKSRRPFFCSACKEYGKIGDAIVYAKFFDPCGSWTWYMTEFNPETGEAFGMVDGFERELGYFSGTELQGIKNRLGLGIERDLHFKPCKLSEIK